MPKEWSVTNINSVLLGLYAILAIAWLMPFMFPAPHLYYFIPFIVILIPYLIFEIKLARTKRPCGHMSIRRAGRFGQFTPFVRPKCPMCGKEVLNVRI